MSYTPIQLDIAFLRKHIADEKLVKLFSGVKFMGNFINTADLIVTDEAISFRMPNDNGGFDLVPLMQNDYFENDQSKLLSKISERYREIDKEIDDYIQSINK